MTPHQQQLPRHFIGGSLIALSGAFAAQAEIVCTGKWGGQADTAFTFDEAGTTVVYRYVDQTFDSAPLTQKRKGVTFKVGSRGNANITITLRRGVMHARWRSGNNTSTTKLACPNGYVLPSLG